MDQFSERLKSGVMRRQLDSGPVEILSDLEEEDRPNSTVKTHE